MDFFQQVNLTINHNWQSTKKVVENLIKLEQHVVPNEYGAADHYELKSLGTISRHRPSEHWYRVSGPAVTRTMSWLPKMLDIMKELKPDEGCISRLKGNGAEHIDLPHLMTSVNYIFDNSDQLAYTSITNKKEVFIYPSCINSAWILNTQLPHKIINNGIRWTLSIHFNTEYGIVKEWFDNNTNLIFE